MKITLILFAIAITGLLSALLLPMFTQRSQTTVTVRHKRVRYRAHTFTVFERLMLPFMRAADTLAFRWNSLWGGNRIVLANGTTENVTGYKTFQATAVAIATAVRVKLDSDGLISAAGATDAWIGTTHEAIAASGYGTVKLRTAPGTLLVTCSAAVAAGAQLYGTASGKVDDAAGTSNFLGLQAVTAGSGDGSIIEAVPSDTLAFAASSAQAAVATTGATNSSPYGFTTAAQADAIVTLVNRIRTDLIAAGIIKGAA